MNWKIILKTIITPVLALVYTYLQGKYPDLPWTQSNFVEQILWILSVAIGGWQANNLKVEIKSKRND